MKQFLIILMVISVNSVFSQHDTTNKNFVEFNPSFSYKMLDQNLDLRKVNILLDEKQKGTVKNNSLIIGGSLISIGDYQKSNTDSKFGYLMRHPTPSNQIGTEVSEIVIHSFQLSFTGIVNSWLAAHTEILYSPEQSFGSGTITAIGRNQLQLRKGFALIGDLDKFPVYLALGKMDTPFGQTGSVSPFTNSTFYHAFGGLGYGGQIGFKSHNFHAKFMAVQGGAQFRALNTPVGNGTNVPSKVNNFVADLNYTIHFSSKTTFYFGASYVHGSAYNQDFPVSHFSPGTDVNPAYTYYGKLNINNRFILKGGYAKTLKVWKGTHNPTPPLDVYEASKVSSLDVGAKLYLNNSEKVQYAISGEFSNFIAGAKGSPWERQNQIVAGFSAMVKKSSMLFLELFRTDGYAPLNFISGSADNNPFPPGVTHSLRSANSMGIVCGVQVSI
jgi:hypothetical protein